MEKGGRNRQTDRDTDRQEDTDTETPNRAREKRGMKGEGKQKGVWTECMWRAGEQSCSGQ